MNIVTHDGKAHADEFMAICLLLAVSREQGSSAKIIRTRDLTDIPQDAFVIDVGRVYDPSRRRFDHHGVEGQERSCALTQVIDYLGYGPTARVASPWVRFLCDRDNNGMDAVLTKIGVWPQNKPLLLNPIENVMLAEFGKRRTLDSQDWLFAAMLAIGETIVERWNTFRQLWPDRASLIRFEQRSMCYAIVDVSAMPIYEAYCAEERSVKADCLVCTDRENTVFNGDTRKLRVPPEKIVFRNKWMMKTARLSQEEILEAIA